LFCVTPATAQEVGRWAVGGNVALNSPLGALKDYTSTSGKYGLNFSYVVSPRVSVEFEYQRMKDQNAALEGAEFVWFIDNRRYVDPDVSHEISWNNVAFNAIVRLGDRPMLTAQQWNPYITIGGGFYRYDSHVTGLVWPGQATAVTGSTSLDPTGGPGPDNSLNLPDSHDRRAALSINTGLGLEAFIIQNVSLDIRARYHMSVGDLRPFNDFGLFQTFPLQQFDIGAGIKFYFLGA
jgi:opacity protein-like surface antigen